MQTAKEMPQSDMSHIASPSNNTKKNREEITNEIPEKLKEIQECWPDAYFTEIVG